MMRPLVVAVFATAFAFSKLAITGVEAYPTKSESDAKLKNDKAECYQIAKTESGFDPEAASLPEGGGQSSLANPATERESSEQQAGQKGDQAKLDQFHKKQGECLQKRGYVVAD